MKLHTIIYAVFLVVANTLTAGNEGSASVLSEVPSWKRHCLDVETGLIWNVGNNTPIAYRIVPSQISWRSPYVFKKDFSNGSKVVMRNQLTLIGDWVQNGPEDYYIGFSGAPSFEWWSPLDKWSVYFAVGGGAGFTNSTDVVGGLGQDFTYNWFAKTGVRYQMDQSFGVYAGVFSSIFRIRVRLIPTPGWMP